MKPLTFLITTGRKQAAYFQVIDVFLQLGISITKFDDVLVIGRGGTGREAVTGAVTMGWYASNERKQGYHQFVLMSF